MTEDTLKTALQEILPELEAIYKDLHSHPELSMQEVRTSGIAADWLTRFGFEVTRNVGGTGVAGLPRNGDGPTVMLRADMDGLPVAEATGLPYVAQAFQQCFGTRAFETTAASASEDFGVFGRRWEVPYVFWVVGGIDADVYAKASKQLGSIPVNHSPKFAPAIHPTLETGVQTLLEAAGAWLRKDAAQT